MDYTPLFANLFVVIVSRRFRPCTFVKLSVAAELESSISLIVMEGL